MLPNFMDLFEWSIPFVAEKVTEMFHSIVVSTDEVADFPAFDEEDEANVSIDGDAVDASALRATRTAPKPGEEDSRGRSSSHADLLKAKVKFISKLLLMRKVLREQSENVIRIKQMNDNRLPQGLLLKG